MILKFKLMKNFIKNSKEINKKIKSIKLYLFKVNFIKKSITKNIFEFDQ